MNNQIKPDVLISQIPGGMLSNLVAQLRQQKAEDKLEAVLAEMPHVRKDLGYPPLVTPTSQMVGAQAALNVMTGKRYSVVAMETRNYVMGLYGEAPGKIGDEIKEKVLGKKEPITCRPADLLKPGLEKARSEAGSMAKSEEDVLTYALFPDIAKDYFLHRDNGGGKQPAAGTKPLAMLLVGSPCYPAASMAVSCLDNLIQRIFDNSHGSGFDQLRD